MALVLAGYSNDVRIRERADGVGFGDYGWESDRRDRAPATAVTRCAEQSPGQWIDRQAECRE